jgi:hypothetical protein
MWHSEGFDVHCVPALPGLLQLAAVQTCLCRLSFPFYHWRLISMRTLPLLSFMSVAMKGPRSILRVSV